MDHVFESPEIQNQLRKYNMHLSSIFEHFSQYTDVNPTSQQSGALLSLKGFQQFTQQFGIAPYVINAEAVTLLFNNITKYIEEGDKGLNFKEFQFALFRLIIRGCSVFDHVFKLYGP